MQSESEESKGKTKKPVKKKTRRESLYGKKNTTGKSTYREHTTNPKVDIWLETTENLRRMNVDIVWIRIV